MQYLLQSSRWLKFATWHAIREIGGDYLFRRGQRGRGDFRAGFQVIHRLHQNLVVHDVGLDGGRPGRRVRRDGELL